MRHAAGNGLWREWYRSEAEALAVWPEATRAPPIGINVAVPSDGHRTVRANADCAVPADAARTIDAPGAAEGARIRNAQDCAEHASDGHGCILGLVRTAHDDFWS